MFESVNAQTHGRTNGRTDGRRLDWYTISSPCEPSAQVSYNGQSQKWVVTVFSLGKYI